jgi:hypothetical protein
MWDKLSAYERQMLASPDQQLSLTDPDSCSMSTSGRGSAERLASENAILRRRDAPAFSHGQDPELNSQTSIHQR